MIYSLANLPAVGVAPPTRVPLSPARARSTPVAKTRRMAQTADAPLAQTNNVDIADKFGWDVNTLEEEAKRDWSDDPRVRELPVSLIRRPIPRSNSASYWRS